jgi:hypothetical protein
MKENFDFLYIVLTFFVNLRSNQWGKTIISSV